MIQVNKDQHNYILSILSNEVSLKDRLLKVSVLVNNIYEYCMDDELEIDFNDFLQDKQVEIGFDENYNPNHDWEKIQILMDKIYSQTN